MISFLISVKGQLLKLSHYEIKPLEVLSTLRKLEKGECWISYVKYVKHVTKSSDMRL